jgi:hypothetical protein
MKMIKAIAIATLISLVGCSSLSVTSDYDSSVDFTKYKTYAWYTGDMPADDALTKNPLVKKRFVHSVDNYMKSHGYTLVEGAKADFVIIMHAGTKEKMQINTYGYGGYGYGMYGRGWGPGYGMNQTDVTYYDEATLIIDFADSQKKELVWRGSATGVLGSPKTQEEMQENANIVVAKILDQLPPKK